MSDLYGDDDDTEDEHMSVDDLLALIKAYGPFTEKRKPIRFMPVPSLESIRTGHLASKQVSNESPATGHS